MMKIEDIVGDIILLILTENEPLKELGITQNKLFAKVVGYDGNGVWIETLISGCLILQKMIQMLSNQ